MVDKGRKVLEELVKARVGLVEERRSMLAIVGKELRGMIAVEVEE